MPRLGALRRASSSVTAGAGLGNWPWAASTVPSPTVIELHTMRSTSSDSKRRARADDVDDGVDGADLVELDVVGGHAVHLAFDIGEHRERSLRPVADALGQIGGVDQVANRAVRRGGDASS